MSWVQGTCLPHALCGLLNHNMLVPPPGLRCAALQRAGHFSQLLHRSLLHVQLPTGVAVVAHQVRRAITLDPQTKLPRLEDTDEPYEAFLAACRRAGLHVRVLSSRETCSNVDTDPMLLLAVGRAEEAVRALPGWENGAGAGSGRVSDGQGSHQ